MDKSMYEDDYSFGIFIRFRFFYDTKMLLVAFSVWCKAWRHSTSRCSEIFCGSIIINLKFRKIVNCCACQMIAKTTFPEKF